MRLSILSMIIRFLAQAGCMGLVGYGLWCIFGSSIKTLFREEHQYRRLQKTVSAKKNKEQILMIAHIKRVMSTVRSRDAKASEVYVFLITSAAIFIFSFLISTKIFTLPFGLSIALISSLFPYMYLRGKLRSIQIDSSYDADAIVTSISNEYKQHSYNMIRAVENTAARFNAEGYSRRVLYRLSLALENYRDEEELDLALNQFVYSYDTEWAMLLRANIKMAIHKGIDVSSGLEDILKKLQDIREQIEVSKRYNTDTFTMIRFLLVPLYFLSVFFAINTYGFTFKKFLEYQFVNVIGLRMAILTFLGIMISFIALMMIRKPRYDI